jgi:hypothetical protein
LPWRDNRRQVSCIPAGSYDVMPYLSPRFGWVYLLTNVFGRSSILTHWGNYAGDVALGWRTHSNGCVITGTTRGVMDGQRAVLGSLPAFRRLFDTIGRQPWRLQIDEVH